VHTRDVVLAWASMNLVVQVLFVSQVTYRGQGDTDHNQRQVMKVRTRTLEKAEIDIQRALKSRQ